MSNSQAYEYYSELIDSQIISVNNLHVSNIITFENAIILAQNNEYLTITFLLTHKKSKYLPTLDNRKTLKSVLSNILETSSISNMQMIDNDELSQTSNNSGKSLTKPRHL